MDKIDSMDAPEPSPLKMSRRPFGPFGPFGPFDPFDPFRSIQVHSVHAAPCPTAPGMLIEVMMIACPPVYGETPISLRTAGSINSSQSGFMHWAKDL